MCLGPPVKVILSQPELFDRIPCSQQCSPDTLRDGESFAIPAYMFACYPDSRCLAVELVQGIQMLKNNITQLVRRQWIGLLLTGEEGVDITKNPRCTMACATDHYSVSAGVRKY
jgi:hypothetical protein